MMWARSACDCQLSCLHAPVSQTGMSCRECMNSGRLRRVDGEGTYS